MHPLEKIFVQRGELVVTANPVQLVTVRGSCVAVCLWDKKIKSGGMNHYLLPVASTEANYSNVGITSTQMLVDSMLNKMSCLKNLQARIFGGGNRFFSGAFSVGPQNIEAAKNVLRQCGIPVVENNTGGEDGRKIYFNVKTGLVTVVPICC
jgi:chemotaxis protein CheD